MATSARIFFAGVGTTFVILGLGFGGGLFMANSALKEPTGYQTKGKAELSPVRVILPTSAEAAQLPQPALQQAAPVDPSPSRDLVKDEPLEKRVQKVDTKKAEMEVRERRKRYAERKARREASLAKHRLERREREYAPVMAFGGDPPQRGLFGY